MGQDIVVRPLLEADLPVADHIMRVAFGTFMGVPNPEKQFGDISYVESRWKANPAWAFAAEVDGECVGSTFAAKWGSFGFFGPLTIKPDLWDRGIGGRLMEPVLSLFSQWGVRLAGLFTFADSPKHLGLYQRFGFHPRFLTAIMSKPVKASSANDSWSLFSDLTGKERKACLQGSVEITDAIYTGLDVTSLIGDIQTHRLGNTVLLWHGGALHGFAACHVGPRTEAGTGRCYVKFAAVPRGPLAEQQFDNLIAACESFAASRSAILLVGGVSTSRQEAYRRLTKQGFRIDIIGVAMHRPNEAAFNRAGVFVMDDWR